jgi:uncharacterized cupin superfamily protein
MYAIDLNAVPVAPTEFGHWAALNAALGVDAFGVNVVEARPGDELDLAHDEIDTGQQEIFVVVAGRARFTVAGEAIDAGPGTVVGVGDPALVRGYQALEPGTRVLCIGARPAPGSAPRWGYWIGGTEP